MKTLRIVLTVAIPLMLFAVGVAVIWEHFSPGGETGEMLRHLLASGLTRVLIGALLILLAVAWALAQVMPDVREHYLVLDKSDSSVRISLGAIADLLGRLNMEFPWLVSVRPDVHICGERLRVDMRCRVKAGLRVPEASRELQHRVRTVLKQTTGLEEVADVLVTIREIAGAPPPIKEHTPDRTELDAEPRVAPWVRGPTTTRDVAE